MKQDIKLYSLKGAADIAANYKQLWETLDSVENLATLEVTNESTVNFIDAIVYGSDCGTDMAEAVTKAAAGTCVVIKKSAYRDFFRIWESYAQVYRTTN